jgi:cyclopropane-fatty-acyl-phospholipid synthase
MELAKQLIVAAETLPLPDVVSRAGIRYLVGRSRSQLNSDAAIADADFAQMMSKRPIAIHTDKANEQHYEVPAEFFSLVLGPHRKYSSCLFDKPGMTLAEGEARALAETTAHADIRNGQTILDMGCGWGSLSLWIAEHYPGATVTAVSNSRSQREYIEATARQRNLQNLTVITSDMNAFETDRRFDRIVSVEMFEHMSNWRMLLGKARQWLAPGGRMFMHVFTHKKAPYLFDESDKTDWIAQHFFTGGIMPSHSLIRQYGDIFSVEDEWRWNGKHYEETARLWLENYDANAQAIRRILNNVYGSEGAVWQRRWRLFFLATMGLFGHAGGEEWGVSHYRLKPVVHG